MKISLEQLQDRLIKLGKTLNEQQRKEFIDILDGFAQSYYEIGEAYKMAVINIIPSKFDPKTYDEPIQGGPLKYKPQQSLQDIAMSLARNLDNQLKKDQEK